MLVEDQVNLETFFGSDTPDYGSLRDRLAELQRACVDADLPVMIAFEGWDAAGKGTFIHTLTARLDPRGFEVHPIRAPRPFELARPWLWRYWLKIPAAGKWAFYDRSWYGRVLVQRIEGIVSKTERKRALNEIGQFERSLVDNGYLIVKLFLHIDKDEQKRRLDALAGDPGTSWKVSDEDWRNHRHYARWYRLYDKTLRKTSTTIAPWWVIPTIEEETATLLVYAVLIHEIEKALQR